LHRKKKAPTITHAPAEDEEVIAEIIPEIEPETKSKTKFRVAISGR